MGRDYKNFMRILLSDEPGEPTLFEPFIHARIAEQLIWRRGEHLWDTPDMYIDTLMALNELTVSDVVIADTRQFGGELDRLYHTIVKYADDRIRFVTICDTEDSARLADRCGGVCAVAVYGDIEANKPAIRMDGTVENAIQSGYAGWYAPIKAEEYWDEYGDRIAILGGLGAEYLTSTGPASIHRRIERLYTVTDNRRYATGSGGMLPEQHYLELISMLGVYKRYKF